MIDYLIAEGLSAFLCGYNHFFTNWNIFPHHGVAIHDAFRLLLQLIDCHRGSCSEVPLKGSTSEVPFKGSFEKTPDPNFNPRDCELFFSFSS